MPQYSIVTRLGAGTAASCVAVVADPEGVTCGGGIAGVNQIAGEAGVAGRVAEQAPGPTMGYQAASGSRVGSRLAMMRGRHATGPRIPETGVGEAW